MRDWRTACSLWVIGLTVGLSVFFAVVGLLLNERESPEARRELGFMKECVEKNTTKRCSELWYWRNR